jgi:hypothetical protein
MSQALANVQYKPTDLTTDRLGEVLVKSGFFQDTKDIAQAIVKVLAGRELGFGPIASMQGVYIVKGRVTLSANLVGAAIQRSGKYRYTVKELTNDRCTLAFRGPENSSFESVFTAQDAQQAGLLSGNYRTFPRNMLFARALTNGARWFCPEVFNGPIYTPDELGATVNDEGDVIDVGTGEVVADRPAAPAPVAMITSVDDKVYQRYVGWTERAAAREIDYEAYGVPVERQKVYDEAVRLKGLVEAAEREAEPAAVA